MASNRRRGLISLALLWATVAALSAQVSAAAEEALVSEPGSPPEVAVVSTKDPVMERLDRLEEELKLGFAKSDADGIIRLERMERQIAEDRSASWVPLLMVSLLLLTPIALFMLGRSLMQRLGGQVDELKRQRLRLESVDESLRELPGKLPKLALDTSQLADRLRDELRQPTPAPVAPAPVVTPFYQNAQWLALAAEPPRRYLAYLAELRATVNQVHVELTDSENPGEALALVGWILARFYERQSACAEGHWRHLLQVAEETGYVNDPALGDRLSKARSDEEAARTLHRALYRELLEQGISDHLILLEEMRHLPNFCGAEASYATCQAISQRIDPLVETFLSRTRRLAGYTPNHVPLFSEFTEEAAQFLRNNPSKELPRIYQSLELPRRQVLCVLAYGLRRERGWENEETQVILS